MGKNKFTMKKRLATNKKWEADSDEQKQIHNEKKRLATNKKWEKESDEQKQIHNEKKTCDKDKTGGRV